MVGRTILILFFPLLVICGGSNIIGLVNYGQTCYANAVFQLLYHNQDFRGSLETYLARAQVCPAQQHLAALKGIFQAMDHQNKAAAVISPNTFEALPDTFEKRTQYDVAEVLQYCQSISDFDWSPFTIEIKENSDLFSEYFLELFLSVPESKVLYLEDLLKEHFLVNGRKIKSLSRNLIMRLKRIRGADVKITDKIIVNERISLQPYCLDPKTPSSYHLEAFIEHCGSCTTGGHYIFYLHHMDSGKYLVLSDERIRELNQQEYLENASKAYLLFFKTDL